MNDIYEGIRAVGAVLADLAPRSPGEPGLRLAERHLRLLARLVAARPWAEPEAMGGEAGGRATAAGEAARWLPEPHGGRHVLQ